MIAGREVSTMVSTHDLSITEGKVGQRSEGNVMIFLQATLKAMIAEKEVSTMVSTHDLSITEGKVGQRSKDNMIFFAGHIESNGCLERSVNHGVNP